MSLVVRDDGLTRGVGLVACGIDGLVGRGVDATSTGPGALGAQLEAVVFRPDIGAHDHGYFILRRRTVSRLEKYLKNRQPSLLITCDADDKFISQIEELLGKKFDLSHPVYSVAHIKAYDIKYMFGN